MKKIFARTIISAFIFTVFSLTISAQTPALLKRTTYKTDTVDFGVGGTFSILGAPNGSISIESWQKKEVEITAEIEVQAANEADLAALAAISGYTLDSSLGRVSVVSVGTFDKEYMKRTAKKFPKNLLALPFRIDYKIKVPSFCDLEVDGGNGDFKLSGVDGAMKINYLNSNADITLTGGTISATFGGGTVSVKIPTRGWRGRFAEIQVVKGDLSVQLPPKLNAEITAKVLRTGKIENSDTELKPRDRKSQFTDQTINAKAGNGGIPINLTVGDGVLKIVSN